MATVFKSGSRKPLATGKLQLSYGMRYDINEGVYGISIILFSKDYRLYTFYLTDDELDATVAFRDQIRLETDEQDKRNA